MNTPLRDEIQEIVKPWAVEMAPDVTNQILNLIASKMPEKDKCEDCGVEFGDDDGHKRLGDMVECPKTGNLTGGWGNYRKNETLDSAKSILKGGTDE